MADKIDQLEINGTLYDIDLPPDATPSIRDLSVSGNVSDGSITKTMTDVLNGINNIPSVSLLGTATSSSNSFVFSNIILGQSYQQGLGLFTFGNTQTLINLYGLTSGTTYKMSGTFVYNTSGAVITTTINLVYNASARTVTISSGNADFKIVNGYTGYLFLVKIQ